MIADRSAALRKVRGWTQAELARKLCVTGNGVNSWEQGLSTPSPAYLVMVANIFLVSTNYLLGLDRSYISNSKGLTDDDIALLSKLADMLRTRQSKPPVERVV